MNEPYPGYTGTLSTSGSVMVTFIGGKTHFSYNLEGLEPKCVDCGVHIHEGTTCDDADAVGGHYFRVDDPWTTEGGAVYNSDGNGEAEGSYSVMSGYDTSTDNVGHAVVIHSQDGARVSCGILK
jgi:Cu/Zn superoxide dismutase